MATLTLNLKSQVRKTQASAVGIEQYNGGEAFETAGSNRLVATFMATSQTVTSVTDAHNLNTAMFDLTLFFVAQAGHGGHGHGGGGGGGGRANAPESIRLQGAVDFEGQQPPTANSNGKDVQRVIGSVSAASPAWQHLIGHEFRLMNLNDPGSTAKLEID
jgi:hypothetical protein